MRRYFTSIIIILIAAAVAWWSSHAESGVSNHVREEVEKLVSRFQKDPSTIHTLVVDPVLEPLLASSLRLVYTESIARAKAFVVIIKEGDSADYGDGTATHIATFQVDNKPVVGLRIICLTDTAPLQIAGVWMP